MMKPFVLLAVVATFALVGYEASAQSADSNETNELAPADASSASLVAGSNQLDKKRYLRTVDTATSMVAEERVVTNPASLIPNWKRYLVDAYLAEKLPHELLSYIKFGRGRLAADDNKHFKAYMAHIRKVEKNISIKLKRLKRQAKKQLKETKAKAKAKAVPWYMKSLQPKKTSGALTDKEMLVISKRMYGAASKPYDDFKTKKETRKTTMGKALGHPEYSS